MEASTALTHEHSRDEGAPAHPGYEGAEWGTVSEAAVGIGAVMTTLQAERLEERRRDFDAEAASEHGMGT